MKKLLFIFALICAFSFNASAQNQKTVSQESAKKDAVALAKLVGLKDNQTEDFYHLFEMKYQILEDKTLSVERKDELERMMDAKIRATLDEKQMAILEANKELYTKLKR